MVGSASRRWIASEAPRPTAPSPMTATCAPAWTFALTATCAPAAMTSVRGRRALSRVSSPSTSGGTTTRVASAKRARIASAACLPSCPKPQIPPCRHALWLFLSPDRQMKSGVLLTYLLASPVQVRPNTSATMWLQTEEEADGTLGCTLLVVPVRELFSIYSNTRATRDAPRFLRQHNRFLRGYR